MLTTPGAAIIFGIYMLTEDDVVAAACRDLKNRGCEITERATTRQRGIDITASNKRHTIVIEAKGATRNRCSSKRYGEPFTKRQCSTHVGVAFFTAASLLAARKPGQTRRVAIALPDNPHHREFADRIAPALRTLGIGLIWVNSSRRVKYVAGWQV